MLKIDSTKIDLEKERINALNLLPEKTLIYATINHLKNLI